MKPLTLFLLLKIIFKGEKYEKFSDFRNYEFNVRGFKQ